MTATQTCSWHPDRETRLSCGQCDKPICVECMRYHPVGIRCKECSRPSTLPTHRLSTDYLVRGLAAMVGLGLAGGIVLTVLSQVPGLGFFRLLLMAGLGYVAGEGIGASVNRRRGRPYQLMAAGAVVLAVGLFLVPRLAVTGGVDVFAVLGGFIAVVVAVNRLRP